ncbi:thioredoxin-disulfide reductase [Spiroplasma eriocheiris]|uniref:Thioredoxin reductase n=1 Tax=Spiroplasma eriocheiris TaxID=315358 RepID=A0A0H3XN70_9MOLU|nr:thioredoxin-disulfide reductase [Spiroplasma eriocheiris]AHF58180.1 putative thioredoxin reductase [Spiroplasma eriocheiris CCTCC M 207170]AKM54617.1 thioredoxin reductase [Spiroplasma eriocheiris]
MKNNTNDIYDILIIGAGPGGMTAAIYGARAMAKIAMIEKGAPGGKMTKTSEIENYPGFDSIQGPELSMKMFMQTQNLNIPYLGDRVVNITKQIDSNLFELKLFSGKILLSKVVIIATGTVERKIGVPGELELYGRGVSYCAVCDGALFKNKDILVVGGGYAALEEALYLTKFVNKVYLVHRRQEFRADDNLLAKAKKNPKIEFILDSVVTKINDPKANKVTSVMIKNVKDNTEQELVVSAVFPYIGSIPITDFVKDLNVLDENGYVITNSRCETKVPGLFAAGDVTNTTLRQIATAVSDGAKAAQFAIEYIDNLK